MDLIIFLLFFGLSFWVIVFFIIVLLIIVVIYEYGYYIVGCWFGIYVEVFLLGFGFVFYFIYDKCGIKW